MVFLAAGLAVDRFDAAHPVPTQLMYALDADTGRRTGQPGDRPAALDGPARRRLGLAADRFPGLGGLTLQGGPAPAAACPHRS